MCLVRRALVAKNLFLLLGGCDDRGNCWVVASLFGALEALVTGWFRGRHWSAPRPKNLLNYWIAVTFGLAFTLGLFALALAL